VYQVLKYQSIRWNRNAD